MTWKILRESLWIGGVRTRVLHMTSTEVATLLQDLAQEIEAGGRVEANAGAWSLGVNPMQPIKLEIQYKPRKRKLEI
ncbi:MAG: amphi-Trp domain-containing protein [Methanotrichaceae archaeon]|nr:amphi-Trp domain-containing protein [Methanotrichaceae archaeon]